MVFADGEGQIAVDQTPLGTVDGHVLVCHCPRTPLPVTGADDTDITVQMNRVAHPANLNEESMQVEKYVHDVTWLQKNVR